MNTTAPSTGWPVVAPAGYRGLAGDIPAYKMGRVLRVRRNDLDAFLETVRVQPGELRHLFPTKNAKAPVESIVDEP